jgi:hypothetical protein
MAVAVVALIRLTKTTSIFPDQAAQAAVAAVV